MSVRDTRCTRIAPGALRDTAFARCQGCAGNSGIMANEELVCYKAGENGKKGRPVTPRQAMECDGEKPVFLAREGFHPVFVTIYAARQQRRAA